MGGDKSFKRETLGIGNGNGTDVVYRTEVRQKEVEGKGKDGQRGKQREGEEILERASWNSSEVNAKVERVGWRRFRAPRN